MIQVSPRARRHEDRAGDPLDGLVNLFDVGIVLAVAFLLAALASFNLSGRITGRAGQAPSGQPVTVRPGEVLRSVPADQRSASGSGTPIGRVYRLNDGQLVYVVPSSALNSPTAPSASPSPTTPSPSR
ncbi:DUF2149 domain-containing protein [uncultured Jatrophihabitans sp.]|uniref:DUF2149 domain-containing protein n=1 Tax=uncultured Jatrophihabitans sp. TaxID=1610747 RepID=UPI0035CC758C